MPERRIFFYNIYLFVCLFFKKVFPDFNFLMEQMCRSNTLNTLTVSISIIRTSGEIGNYRIIAFIIYIFGFYSLSNFFN